MGKPGIIVSGDDDYYTPKHVVDSFGQFDYDPATTSTQAKYLNIPNYDTIETNGLSKDWSQYKRIWINPPFTLKFDFLNKAVATYKESKADIYILFPIESLTTHKFHNSQVKVHLYIPRGRIQFSGKKNTGVAFGSVIFKLSDENKLDYIDFQTQLF